MKTAFVLLHIPDPRMNKRISLAKQLGECSILAFRKSVFNVWEPFHRDVEHRIIDFDIPSIKHPITRLKSTPQLRKHILSFLNEQQPDCVYTSGLDALSVIVEYKRKHPSLVIVYEVADLNSLQLSEEKDFAHLLLTNIINSIERRMLKKVDLLVLTSEKFFDEHFGIFYPIEKTVVVPNIPDFTPFDTYKKKCGGRFTVGFIGGIRYINQLKMLADVTNKIDIDVIFAGGGALPGQLEQFKLYCKDYSNVRFTGTYNYNNDIARLYSQVDCVYAVYDSSIKNVRIALPNKLYEAVYCGLPIIVSKDTYLAEIVADWAVGESVDCTDPSELRSVLISYRDGGTKNSQLIESLRHASSEIQSDRSLQILFERITDLINR